MAIVNKDGFEFYSDIKGDPDYFLFKGVDLNVELEYVKRENIKSVAFDFFYSKEIRNLDFLENLKQIEKVSLDDVDFNFNGLYYLHLLKDLSITIKNKDQHLDFSKFLNIKRLSINWYINFPNLTKNTKLKELKIWKFRPKSKSLSALRLPQEIEILKISETNILNLEGLEVSNLREFEGYYCNSLVSLKGIDKFSKTLNVLVLDYCRKLTFYNSLENLVNLEKLIIGDCGDIPDIQWINNLKRINHFSFWNTKLLDGDTSPCLGIEYVSFKNQKYFNYKLEDIIERKYKL